MAAYDDLNTKRIFTVGILSIVVTAVTALAVQVVYYKLVSMHEEDLAERSSYRRQNQLVAKQAEEISDYGVDPDTGSVTIPVSQAMQLIAANNDDGDHTDHKAETDDTAAKHDAKSTDADDHKKDASKAEDKPAGEDVEKAEAAKEDTPKPEEVKEPAETTKEDAKDDSSKEESTDPKKEDEKKEASDDA